eukprot:CAMPEP_0183715558 /NCGR_PEP_ID=MMETSP0737-20130205/9720_1 /TAXON_ID=385413 /ORGANISM="Thalassiosira miniscula, Strain CCMP1093" /LENGTH=119 /DNA_ID=CAMNT_0025944659 /DNA_START=183 /DNA_END=539 /DNA_ORIENTATION=-
MHEKRCFQKIKIKIDDDDAEDDGCGRSCQNWSYLELLFVDPSPIDDGNDHLNDRKEDGTNFSPATLLRIVRTRIVRTLLCIINDKNEILTTEGHRETSVEILQQLSHHAFGTDVAPPSM